MAVHLGHEGAVALVLRADELRDEELAVPLGEHLARVRVRVSVSVRVRVNVRVRVRVRG